MLTTILLLACSDKDATTGDSGAVTTDDSGQTEVVDADGDGYTDDDCNDSDAAVFPGAVEVCNSVDDNCDGEIDEGLEQTWYADRDGDLYGDETTTVEACAQPEGYVSTALDCDDYDAAYRPNADEDDCTDPNDYNCDGSAGYSDLDGDGYAACEDCDDLDEDVNDAQLWFRDEDGDGFGNAAVTIESCGVGGGYVASATDCDDSDANTNPDADETCDGEDDNCNGAVDENPVDGTDWYLDRDGDLYGDADSSTTSCTAPSGYIDESTDCDDRDATVYPGADETCDGDDEDCDSTVDEEPVDGDTWYADDDGDGYGDPDDSTVSCDAPSGYIADGSDCDDADSSAAPSETEVCDDADNDCDGLVDWGLRVPTDEVEIQDAIDAATSGDTICVEAGTYSELIDTDGKDLTIEGVDGSASTTIDGDGDGRVVSIQGGEEVTLTALTITGGDDNDGAGIYLYSSSLFLDDVVVSANECDSASNCSGVALYAYGSELSASEVEFSSNSAAGSTVYGVVALLSTNAEFEDVSIDDNTIEGSSSAWGSALYLDASSNGDWVGGTVSGNTTDAYYTYGTVAAYYGGDLNLSQVAITDNTIDSEWIYGGALLAYYSGSHIELENVIVANNDSDAYYRAWGGGLTAYYYSTIDATNVDIVGNSATSSYYNSSSYECGGGVFTYYGSLEFVNANIVENYAPYGNEVCTYSSSSYGTWSFEYSNVYNSAGNETYNVTFSSGSDGNISTGPEYVDASSADAADWDLTLDTGSPCIDAGDPSILDADGSTSDIGCYGGPDGSW